MPAWVLDALEDITAADVVMWCVGGLVVLGAIWKGWPAIKNTIRALNAAVTLSEMIAKELKPNGGRSIKDRSEQTAQALAETTAALGEMRSQLAEVVAAQASLSADVSHVRRQAASLKTSLAKTNRRLSDHIDAGPS